MRVMISCGEPSGDLYAGSLATELRARVPDVEIFGLGGERLASSGADVVAHYRDIAVTGLTEAVRVIPDSLRLLRTLTAQAAHRRPDVFVAVDFPDFNFRLMARLHKLGVPVVYYISPQLWAWRTGRMKTMRRLVSKVLVIFPFEQEIYARAGVPVQFVGHPLVEMSTMAVAGFDRQVFLQNLGLSTSAHTVALLPGSRHNELMRHVPVLTGTIARLSEQVPNVQFVVARAPHVQDSLLMPLRQAALEAGRPLVTVRDATDAVLAGTDVAITASGTATVQCAIHRRPMVVIYKLSAMTHALLRPFVRVSAAAMPNLIAGRSIVPELIQRDCTPERVAAETAVLLNDAARHARMRDDLGEVRDKLSLPGASARAAGDRRRAQARGCRCRQGMMGGHVHTE
jgi:lipid-A-disaccharide synthase